jgi:hypothetical protein
MELTYDLLKHALREVLDEELGLKRLPALARKWEGGSLLIQAADDTLKPKEIPMEVFFKKITAVRERLRVLEQKLNHHPTLSPEDRAEFQAYISKAYGSLTTFNILFQEEEDKFAGSKGD